MAREILTQRHGEKGGPARPPHDAPIGRARSPSAISDIASTIKRVVCFNDFFADDTRNGFKIPQSEYATDGSHIIIDQGDNEIAGYSDREDGLYTSVPVVVFGDHTRIVKYVNRPFFLGADGVKILKPKEGILPLYSFYALKAARIESLGYSRHFKLVKEIRFPLPPLPEQKRIAAILDKICEMKRNAEARLQKLDLLVKARFVEMFGDPVSNPQKWDVARIEDFADVKIGPFGSVLHKEDYVVGGHALVNPSHMVDGKIIVDESLTISDDKYSELEVYHLRIGDVVVARRGEIGRCALVQREGLICGTGSMFIRIKKRCRPDSSGTHAV